MAGGNASQHYHYCRTVILIKRNVPIKYLHLFRRQKIFCLHLSQAHIRLMFILYLLICMMILYKFRFNHIEFVNCWFIILDCLVGKKERSSSLNAINFREMQRAFVNRKWSVLALHKQVKWNINHFRCANWKSDTVFVRWKEMQI